MRAGLASSVGRRAFLKAALAVGALAPVLAACAAPPAPTPTTAPAAPAPPTSAPAKPTEAAKPAAEAAKPTEAPKPAAEPTKPAAAAAATKPAEPTKPAVQPAGAAAARRTLRWWSNYGLEHPINQALQKTLLPKYQALQAGSNIDIVFVSNTDLVPKFGTARMAGQAPDVFENFAGRGQLWHYGYILPLQDEVKRWGVWDDLLPTMRRIVTVGGDMTGFPGLVGTKMYVYNVEAFQDAGLDPNKFPSTWDEFGEAVTKLTKRDGAGKITRSGLRMGRIADWEQITTYAYQNGVREFDEAIKGKSTVNQPPFMEAFTWFLDLKRKLKVTPLEGEEYPPGTWPVVQGLAAIEYVGPWWVPQMRVQKPEGAEKVKVAPPLMRRGGGERVGLSNANSNLSIYKHSDALPQALEAVRLVATDEDVQIAHHSATGPKGEVQELFFSARKSINEKIPWLKNEPLVKSTAYAQFLDSGDDVGYAHVGYREMAINIWGSTVERATFGVVSDKQALDDAARRADAVTARILNAGA